MTKKIRKKKLFFLKNKFKNKKIKKKKNEKPNFPISNFNIIFL